VGAAASRRVLTSSIYNKKRTVFNKRVRPLSADAVLKNFSGRRYAEPLPRNTLKLKPLGRAWCGHARPNDYPLHWQKFDLKIPILWYNNGRKS